MGFVLRENSYLLKCYPTIKVFCGLAVKHRGPEVEITGFSFWLRHKFPLTELWASPFISACVTLAVPLLGAGGATQGNSCHPCDVLELPQPWRECCLCITRRWWESLWCQNLHVQTPREMFLLCPTPAVGEPFLWHVLLWALLVVQMQPEIFLSSSSPLRAKIQALTSGFLSSPKLHQSLLMLWIYNLASLSSTHSCIY